MKKLPILLLGLVIIFLSFLTLRLPSFSLAACNPPNDYSDCPTARTGPKIAGNTDPDNYVKIRQEYNAVGYTNQWIPTTVIYQVETPYEVLRDNLAEMKKNGLLPIIRPWDSTNEENIKRFAGDLNRVLREVSFPHDVILYAFNEPNLPEGPYQANPHSAAAAISALIQGAGENPLYKIYLPPMAGHQGGAEETFARAILNYKMPDGRTIAEAVDGAALTMYQWTIEEFSADLNRWVNLLSQYGVGEIIISELGPYKNGALLQNIKDIPEWEAKMSEIFRRIKTDPSFLAEASLINTSFFLDINGDGKADITLLVIIHEDGTVEVIAVPLKGSIYWPGERLQCNLSNPGDFDSRPVPCDACNKTDLLTGSCAETFTVNDTVSFEWWEGEECPATPKEDYWVFPEWGGIVTIDPSDTTIPFVGKKGQEDEQKYLADYFEGTGFYYRPPYDLTKLEDVLRVFAEGGVWKKLAPMQLQDEMKKQMVYRAIYSKLGKIQEGAIHDYLVEYNGESAKLSDFEEHFPPEDPVERGKWERETKWGRLWAAVPMFSREDTPGKITPYLGFRPEDKFEILNPEAQIEKVPHVARLYEVTQAINKTLMPLIYQALGIPQVKREQTKTFLASAKDKVLGEKTYLAQAGGSLSVDFRISLSPKGGNQYDLCWDITGSASGDCDYADWTYRIDPYGFEHTLGKHPFTRNPSINCHSPGAHPITVTANPGSSICATFVMRNGVCRGSCCDPDPRDSFEQTSCCQIDENGVPTCGMGPAPEPPSCGLRAPTPVNACYKPAITDPNPNDDLCCDPINIRLEAKDSFEITEWYKKCWEREYVEVPPRPCGSREENVNRKIGISLLHPYLSEIWDYTSDIFGFFNIFRPETVPEFEPLDAASSIFYSYNSGNASPPGGEFYFPYLGGIQKAKEWVIKTLNPAGGT